MLNIFVIMFCKFFTSSLASDSSRTLIFPPKNDNTLNECIEHLITANLEDTEIIGLVSTTIENFIGFSKSRQIILYNPQQKHTLQVGYNINYVIFISNVSEFKSIFNNLTESGFYLKKQSFSFKYFIVLTFSVDSKREVKEIYETLWQFDLQKVI